MDTIITAILLICFLTGLFLTWFFIHRARAKERLLLIEKGIELSNLPKKGFFRVKFPWLKIGILITSISFGLLVAFILTKKIQFFHTNAGERDPSSLFIFLFGGIGMILAYILDKPKEQK